MKKYLILLVLFLVGNTCLLVAQQPFNLEMGLSSYVGGYYYPDNETKDFEYKSNHKWYLNISKAISENILTSAEISYYPELFDKKLYLYSAQVSYLSDSDFLFSWEFDRVGLGRTNKIYQNSLNDIRSDQNYITDYRFNGAVIKHRLFDDLFVEYRAGGNDYNTGIGGLEFSVNQGNLKLQQAFIMVSRDNRFNAKAININNLVSWDSDSFFIQNMFHNSYIDYYRKDADVKSTVIKDMIETRFVLTSFLETQLSFYYEAENWDKYKIYEGNVLMNIAVYNYELTPAFRFIDYLDALQREYSFLINYHLHPKWDVGLSTKYITTPNNQEIISYGLQTKFNLPLNSDNLNSFLK